ncbi:hypothetical protein NLU13_9052 [Sarocladium strictum]|uniref:Uncharacterized protein n=1 Tax=Sarocladium strictum TaxID=5046 RepID=A0AA39GAU4_SARSR|nr:hypothetical protein NLU13_9052 [Sarocladium strictum]
MPAAPGDIAAWAALAAALLALLSASAQVAQQYAATAQNMRKCERSVWGPMPGHAGRRVWVWRQLRFRIVYDMPNLFLPAEYWQSPGNMRQFEEHRITTLPAPFDLRPKRGRGRRSKAVEEHVAIPTTRSEACWVSFSRQLSQVCPSAFRVGLLAGDVDRLPADLPVVPMQVSLRDMIAFGLLTGLSLQAASWDHIEMSGPSGFLKSSSHPFLGHLVHFTCLSNTLRSTLLNGDISKSWLRRLEGVASVAGQEFDSSKRQYYISLGLRWRTTRVRAPFKPPAVSPSDPDEDDEQQVEDGSEEEEEEIMLQFVDIAGDEHPVPVSKCETWDQLIALLERENIAKAPFVIRGVDDKLIIPRSWRTLHRVLCQGDLKIKLKISQGDYALLAPRQPALKVTPTGSGSSGLGEQQAVELGPMSTAQPGASDETVSMMVKRRQPRKKKKKKKASKGGRKVLALTASAHDEEHGDRQTSTPSSSRRSSSSEGSSTTSLSDRRKQISRLGHVRNSSGSDETHGSISGSPDSSRERAASFIRPSPDSDNTDDDDDDRGSFVRMRPQFEYDTEAYWRDKMGSAYVNMTTRTYTPAPPVLSFFWASQIDVELGPWATPWSHGLHAAARSALPMLVQVALAGLSLTLGQTKQASSGRGDGMSPPLGGQQVVYGQLPDHGVLGLDDLWTRLRGGGRTWPPYAINARGGVTDVDTTLLVPFPLFGEDVHLPPLTLSQALREEASLSAAMSYSSRKRMRKGSGDLSRARTLEVASIDLWLSRAAMTRAIREGGVGGMNMTSIAPALVEELWLDFANRIVRTYHDRWSRDGGDSAVRQLAVDMTEEMALTVSTPCERCFVWVAFLRAVKVMQCIDEGPRTQGALGIFREDIPVYLV